MPEQDYGLTGSVSDPNSYPEMEGVDWNNASNRMAYIQNQHLPSLDKNLDH